MANPKNNTVANDNQITQQLRQQPARMNINTRKFIENSTETTRKVQIQSNTSTVTLIKLNLQKLANYLDANFEKVDKVQYLKSGGIFVTCKTFINSPLLPECKP